MWPADENSCPPLVYKLIFDDKYDAARSEHCEYELVIKNDLNFGKNIDEFKNDFQNMKHK